MAKCTAAIQGFPVVRKRQVEVNFGGGHVTSDAGALLLAKIDRRLDLTRRIAGETQDPRRKQNRDHSLLNLVRQRVYGLALGYEDLNDHDTLRKDPLLQTAIDQDRDLASSPTLCRFENRVTRAQCWAMARAFVEVFVESFKTPPTELILDFDSTDDRVHGEQIGRHFHGHYAAYCLLPLYVFCGSQLLVSYLRPGTACGTLHAWAILKLLVRRLRQTWPEVKIVYRGDADFMTGHILTWCEKNSVDYIVGIRGYQPLKRAAKDILADAIARQAETKETALVYGEVRYKSQKSELRKSWPIERRVLVKVTSDVDETMQRFVITSLTGDPQDLYENAYNPRGNMENRIKEQKLALFSDRTSCHEWYPNQLRLLFSSLAYVLLDGIRRLALVGTELARAQCDTLRLRLLKAGAVVLRNSRRVRVLISSAFPLQDVFRTVADRLSTE